MDTLWAIETLARLYELQEKYPQAESLYSRSLEGFRRTMGEDNPQT